MKINSNIIPLLNHQLQLEFHLWMSEAVKLSLEVRRCSDHEILDKSV